MTELKTLKEIPMLERTYWQIRKEAKKWYKNLNNIDEGDWRKFFNITEDDLK